MMGIEIEPLTGEALKEALPALARLRIAVFRDWPYLYDGSLDYEQGYLQKFASSPNTILVVARDGAKIVGASTASPMEGHADGFADAVRAKGFDTKRIYYCGESVLLPEYRGHGIGHAFFDHREARARALGGYTHTAFCGVVREADHPLRPASYRPLDAFWRKRGYQKVEGLIAQFEWRDIDKPSADSKPMQFWMRPL
jgi:GNAT superfamily N-acetyltransferase